MELAKAGADDIATALNVQLRSDISGVNVDAIPYDVIGGEPVLRAKIEILKSPSDSPSCQ